MKIKKSNLYAILAAICVLIFSLNILPLYIDGDQLHYRDFYKYCFYDSLTLSQQFFCYQNTLGSQEPGYFFISKLASIYLEKDIFIAIANTILTFFMTILILKYYQKNWQRIAFIVLIITNYYFIVMLLSAGIACAKKFDTKLRSTPLLSNALFKAVVLEFTVNPV